MWWLQIELLERQKLEDESQKRDEVGKECTPAVRLFNIGTSKEGPRLTQHFTFLIR